MDRGTVQNFMDIGLLTLDGAAGVGRQIASALGFIHKNRRVHNDVKPENILLCQAPDGDRLIAKLADLGLADYSTERRRDKELFGYTLWCMALTREFKRCPATEEDRRKSVDEFNTRTSGSDRALSKALAGVLEGMWL